MIGAILSCAFCHAPCFAVVTLIPRHAESFSKKHERLPAEVVIFAETKRFAMKKYALLLLMSVFPLLSASQQAQPFNVSIRNDEYQIYIKMNLYGKDIIVPGQEVLGRVDGYIGSDQSTGKWIITSSRITGEREAEIEAVNDYGSEDFTAVIRLNADGTYSYRKKGGSALKFAVKGKWQKIPGGMTLKKQ